MEFVITQLSGFGVSLVSLALDPVTYLYLVPAVFLGIVFGALPGLTATLAVTILTGFFGNKFPLDQALIALIGAYVGAIYGGSYPSILLNIPGTAASAATAGGEADSRPGSFTSTTDPSASGLAAQTPSATVSLHSS